MSEIKLPVRHTTQFIYGWTHRKSSTYGQHRSSTQPRPPPGLKTTGTPPVSGGMTFGQGNGFTTGGMPYGTGNANARNQNEEMMRELLRNRGADSTTKRELPYPYPGQSNAAVYGSMTASYTPPPSGTYTGSHQSFAGRLREKRLKKSTSLFRPKDNC